jgi:hypothetical protein
MSKKFLIPVSIAAAALSPTGVNASIESKQIKAPSDSTSSERTKNTGVTEQMMTFTRGDEKHQLLMKKSEAGIIFAAHQSHASHASHGSHRSSR